MREKVSGTNPELPIIVDEERFEGKPINRRVRLAEWYETALRDELAKSKKTASHPDFKIGPKEYLDFIKEAIEVNYNYEKILSRFYRYYQRTFCLRVQLHPLVGYDALKDPSST